MDPKYVPQDDVAKAAFEEMQIFMYAVMAEHLKTDKRKSLVSQYEKGHDAQSIYHDLKKHALGSTSAWLSGDALLKYITSAPRRLAQNSFCLCVTLERTGKEV
jgi:hypothetical protein